MSEKKTFILLSIGQMVNSDVDKSIAEFANFVFNSSAVLKFFGDTVGKFFAKLYTKAKLFIDDTILGSHVVTKFKEGLTDVIDFYHQICDTLGINIPMSAFKDAWNKMSIVDFDTLNNFKELVENYKDSDVKICVFAPSNVEHFDLITQTYRENGIEILDQDRIKIITSFEEATANEKQLVGQLLQKSGYTKDDDLVCLHNRFKSVKDFPKDMVQGSFTYIPYDTRIPGISLTKLVQAKVGNGKILEKDDIEMSSQTVYRDMVEQSKQNIQQNDKSLI